VKKENALYVLCGVLVFTLGCLYAYIACHSPCDMVTLATGGMVALYSYICGFAGGKHYMKKES